MLLKILAITADGYVRKILVRNEEQILSADTRVKEDIVDEHIGVIIDPKEFPEAVKFLVSFK